MTETHAAARDEHRSAGTAEDLGNGTAARNTPDHAASPFASYHPADYVRDVVAVLVLLLALALPWSAADRGADRVEVVLATAVSLASLSLPYLARFGALPATWTVQSTRKWRVWANAPAIAVSFVVVLLDLVTGSGVGTGLGLGLAGALLAAAPRDSELGPSDLDGRVHERWRTVLLVAGGLVGAGALVAFAQTYFSDRELGPMLRAPIGLAMVAGILVLLVVATWRRDRAARLVLLALGVVLIVLALFTSGGALVGVESMHDQRFGLTLVPALAALAAAPAVRRSPVWESRSPASEPGAVDVWVRAAVRAFQVLALLALCSALGGVATLVSGGFDVAPLLRLVLSAVIAGVAWFGQRSLRRDTSSGHVPAVGAACVTGVLGLVVVVAASGGGSAVRIVDLVMALGLPGIAAFALMVPKAVREHFDTAGIAGEGPVDHSPAWVWAPAAESRPATLPENPARRREQLPTGGTQTAGRPPAGTAPARPEVPAAAPASGNDPTTAFDRGATAAMMPVPSGGQQPESGGTEAVGSGAEASGAGSSGTAAPVPAEDPADAAEPASERPRKRVSSTGAVRTHAGQGRRDSSGEQPSVSQVAQEPTAREMQSLANQNPAQQAPAQQAAQQTAVMQPVQGGEPQRQSRGWTPGVALDPRTSLADLAVIVQEAPHLRPHVARNPSTYPALLDWLGALGDPDVDAALRARR
ncbi:hypothetical protein GCM10028784_02770 [Myceligenerans cantabricum]